MSRISQAQAAIALHRFGLGPHPGSTRAIAQDPRAATRAELEQPNAGFIVASNLLSSGETSRAIVEDRLARKARRQQRNAAKEMVGDSPQVSSEAMLPPLEPGGGNSIPGFYMREATARLEAALGADIGFVERLVWFWSNHFSVSAARVKGVTGAFEREAVRPYVLGRFADMLLAAESHPAMLVYLDNTRSIGPNSEIGVRRRERRVGLNENFAREILELHTLGDPGAYTQDDVTTFAKVLTGWAVVSLKDRQRGGEFYFNERTHEPGEKVLLGKRYPDGGMEQGKAVLADLARHRATARHIATRLATHFVADSPPPTLVTRLAEKFLETDGNLKEVAGALLDSAESWEAPRAKLKRPSEWIVAAWRASNTPTVNIDAIVQAQNMLGEPLWRPPSPKGFSDDSATWLNGLPQRLDIASNMARRMEALVDPTETLDEVLGPLASAETRSAIARAESRKQALTLLFMAPEFQRR
jgi:uncharacterized protein (DUF1800 family)